MDNADGSISTTLKNRPELAFLNRSLEALDPESPIYVWEDEPLLDAIKLMKEHRLGCLMVVDNDEKLCGIFSERDVLFKLYQSDIDLDKTPVKAYMTPNPTSEKMESTIAAALYKMSKGSFRHLPIVDSNSKPIALLSVEDIMDFISIELVRNLFSEK